MLEQIVIFTLDVDEFDLLVIKLRSCNMTGRYMSMWMIEPLSRRYVQILVQSVKKC